ncbi:DUF4145 domain-containing protein [Clostridiaceae bacterium M8S5]|nr:DUF4145 domain-containing protein [Clostridiaceae bacterium M8S5]
MKIVQPSLDLNAYTCPYCNTLAEQIKSVASIYNVNNSKVISSNNNPTAISRVTIVTCNCCKQYQIWHESNMMIPKVSTLPLPADDMPDDVKNIYEEARAVFYTSKRSAAALLRLSLQLLCVHLGEKGENINSDIKNLVAKGLDPRIQKSLDILRITGNSAVHPGELNIDEDEQLTLRLFDLMNFIVMKMITEPKMIDDFFEKMPEGKKEYIEKRDAN